MCMTILRTLKGLLVNRANCCQRRSHVLSLPPCVGVGDMPFNFGEKKNIHRCNSLKRRACVGAQQKRSFLTNYHHHWKLLRQIRYEFRKERNRCIESSCECSLSELQSLLSKGLPLSGAAEIFYTHTHCQAPERTCMRTHLCRFAQQCSPDLSSHEGNLKKLAAATATLVHEVLVMAPSLLCNTAARNAWGV